MDHVLILKAGDIRQDGDEQREIRMTGLGVDCYTRGSGYTSSPKTPREKNDIHYTPWTPIKFLFGESILKSDLMHMQFRRRL